MDTIPVPQPRRKLNSDSTDMEDHRSESPFFQSKPIQVIHTVEVHNSLGITSTNEDSSSKGSERKKKKLKRKGTYSVNKGNLKKSQETGKNAEVLDIQSLTGSPKQNNSGTETLSDGSVSSSSNKIKLMPLMGKERRKKPSGYATETLSEESDTGEKQHKALPIQKRKGESSKRNKEIDEPRSPENERIPLLHNESPFKVEQKDLSDALSIKSMCTISSAPVPLPRKSLSRSLENLLEDNQPSVLGSPHSYCTSSSMDYKDPGTLPKQKFRKQRRKKKLKDQLSDSMKVENGDNPSKKARSPEMQCVEEKCQKLLDKSDDCICLTIHHCEPLKISDFKTKPYVKITFMYLDGNFIKNAKGEIIEPLRTMSYDYTCHRSTIPSWNEDLIVMEPMKLLLNKNSLLIFEIIDEEKSKGITWGFLKVMAANGAVNVGKKLRLQLFKPGKPNKDNSIPQAFNWWKKVEKKKYKSTLFLTLTGIPRKIIVNNKVNSPKRREILEKSSDKSVENLTESEDKDIENVKWGRLPSLSCKLPNVFLARLPAGPEGSIAIAYSHSGLLLAAANKVNVGVYTFKGRPYLSLQGHRGLVYSVKWSPNDKYLLSASADFSSCVWDVGRKLSSPIQVLSHPSYVYSCTWLDNATFATGCFDSDIRVWKLGSLSVHQQAMRHTGQVNSIIGFDKWMVSGDSNGAVCIWKRDKEGSIEFDRELTIREIKGKIINKLSIHPGKKRLLVHTRDSVLRMVDMATGSVLLWFQGLVNTKLREDSGFCGCGSLVLAWSEDSSLLVWDGNTGTQVAVYPGLAPDFFPGAVDFHPRDHMMALSGHSSLSPTLFILGYDKKSDGKGVSLVLLNKNIKSTSSSSDLRIPYSDRSSESTPKKKESLLKTLLGSRRKPKKETSAVSSIENSFIDFSKLHGVPGHTEFVEGAEKESRLTNIIRKMDTILTAVSSNKSNYAA